MVFALSFPRALAYTCVIAGLALTLARTFVLDNNLLTSGIIFSAGGCVVQMLLLDFAREPYVIGARDHVRVKAGNARSAHPKQRMRPGSGPKFVLSKGRAVAYACVVAGFALTLARTFVLDNNILTSGVILVTVGALAETLLLDFARESYMIVDQDEFLLNYDTRDLQM
mmetsp:Transcript_11445/g.39046  ORF Transcript_11445/g.39046 Transcript_11445/m.39046 type:complete len:169 (-) Transcript_11445:231-737(-)